MLKSNIFEKMQNIPLKLLPQKSLKPLAKIRGRIRGKSYEILRFQREGLHLWLNNKNKVLEYWNKYRHLDTIATITNINERSSILDIGCGIATVLHFLPGNKHGIDPLGDEYSELYNYPKAIKIIHKTGECLPFDNNSVDLVICSNAIDHTNSPRATIEEIWRVLKSEGYFWLTVEIFETSNKRDAAHPHAITTESLNDLINPDNWKTISSWESPWIGVYPYLQGNTSYTQIESVKLLQKKPHNTTKSSINRTHRKI